MARWKMRLQRRRRLRRRREGSCLRSKSATSPICFQRREGHRRAGYGYEDYLREYRAWRDALRKAIPEIAFAGPDAAVATEWVTRFAADEGKDVKLLTHHYYREGQNPTSSIDKLLHPDPKLGPVMKKLKAAFGSLAERHIESARRTRFLAGANPG